MTRLPRALPQPLFFFKLFLVALSILGHPLSKHEVFNLKKNKVFFFQNNYVHLSFSNIWVVFHEKYRSLLLFLFGCISYPGCLFPCGSAGIKCRNFMDLTGNLTQLSCTFIENCIRRRKMYFVYY